MAEKTEDVRQGDTAPGHPVTKILIISTALAAVILAGLAIF